MCWSSYEKQQLLEEELTREEAPRFEPENELDEPEPVEEAERELVQA